jgi:hypothetical protein
VLLINGVAVEQIANCLPETTPPAVALRIAMLEARGRFS